jgi:integrase
MRVYKRGKFYHFEFVVNGERVQRSSKLTNRQGAIEEMMKERTRLVKGEPKAALAPSEVPTLEQFRERFLKFVASTTDNAGTRQFYAGCYERICEYKPLGRARLNAIDESLIEQFKLWALEGRTRATVNRYLETLKKCLRYASLRLRIMDRVPVIVRYPGERIREYVFTDGEFQEWLDMAPEPLRSASILARECGICRGELLALQRDCIDLRDYEDSDGFWGVIHVRRGLKREARRRDLPITRAMVAVLHDLLKQSKCEHLFTALRDHGKPLTADTLANQHRRVVALGKSKPDAGLHALRHTALTEFGKYTNNVKALQRLAGHSRIETTARYLHPEQSEMDRIASFAQRAREERAAEALRHTSVPTISSTLN